MIVPVSGTDPYAWKGYEPPQKSIWIRNCKAADEMKEGEH